MTTHPKIGQRKCAQPRRAGRPDIATAVRGASSVLGKDLPPHLRQFVEEQAIAMLREFDKEQERRRKLN